MQKAKIPFVDFYSRHGIIPTRQDISNLRRHIERRKSLYRHLGLPAGFFKGISILEFGPGSGHNALVTGLLRPDRYLLVDGNPPSLASTRKHLRRHCPKLNYQLKKASITGFQTKERFDLVLAEGLVPTQANPSRFLRHIAQFVNSSGVLVFTTMDAISLLPELLRRWTAWQLTHKLENLRDKVSLLVDFFDEDVKALPGMSRSAEDWVLDQMLHPWSGPLYSIPQAVGALGSGWSLLGCSPRFLADWRWYKTIYGREAGNNTFAIRSYYEQAHNLIDHRHIANALPEANNRRLEKLAHEIYMLTFRQEHSGRSTPAKQMASKVAAISKLLEVPLPRSAAALDDFVRACGNKDLLNADFGKFRILWGRGQQYLSFVRI